MNYSRVYRIEGAIIFAVDWGWQKSGQWTRSRANVWGVGWSNLGDLDDSAYKALVNIFEIPKDEYSLEQISKMSPAELVRVGLKNPKSHTLGDNRLASEVH